MRWAAGVLALALFLGGCTGTVDGAPRPADSALRELPTDDEITAAAGSPLSTFGFQPFVGGPEILPDGFRTDDDASPIGCVGVTDTTTRVVYESLPLLEAARQSYFNWDEGVALSGADAAVIRFGDADEAQKAFGGFVDRWQQCDGTTVDKRLRGVTGAEVFATIDGVTVDGPMLSATLRTRSSTGGAESVYQRALGVRGQTIVEVSLAVTAAGEGTPDAGTAAVEVAGAMLEKARP